MKLPFANFMSKSVVAVDIGSSGIKIVQMRHGKNGWMLEKMGAGELPPEAIVDGSIVDKEAVISTLKELISAQGVKARDAAVALTGQSVIIKMVSLPAMTEDELAESIQWEAEQYIPFPIADVDMDFQIVGEGEGGQMEVMLVAVKKEVINEYTSVVRDAGLTPVVVDVDAFALENMMEIDGFLAPEENVVLINIGASVTSISVLSGGTTAFTRSVPMGGNQYVDEIQSRFDISHADAENAKTGQEVQGVDAAELTALIDKVSSGLIMEIKRSLDYFLGGHLDMQVSKLFLSGGGARLAGLVDTMKEKTGIEVEMVNPFSAIECNSKHFDPEQMESVASRFAVGVGLATRRLGDK